MDWMAGAVEGSRRGRAKTGYLGTDSSRSTPAILFLHHFFLPHHFPFLNMILVMIVVTIARHDGEGGAMVIDGFDDDR